MKYLVKWDFFCVPFIDRLKWEHPITQTIYMWMCRFVWDDDICYPSRQKLSDVCWCWLRSIDTYIQRLVDLNVIEKNLRFKDCEKISSEYKILYPSAGDALPSAGDAHSINTLNIIYIATKQDISDLLDYWEINDNRVVLWYLMKMIELWYLLEKDKKEIFLFIDWIKEKASIYWYRNLAGDIDRAKFTMQFDKRYEYHKYKKDKIDNFKMSLITFLAPKDNNKWKQKK